MNSFGDWFRITTFGESHGPAIRVVVDGVRAGLPIDLAAVQADLDRRRPGQSRLTTQRKESDTVEVLSGVFEGRTTGTPIALLLRNTDAKSHHYEAIRDAVRPGHADFTYLAKYGIRDWRGGGRASARETAARVAAGGIAKQLIESAHGIRVVGRVVQIGEIHCPTHTIPPPDPSAWQADTINANPVRCADPAAADRMAEAVEAARKQGDSLGGVVEVVAWPMPVGWGEPIYDKLPAAVGSAMLSINAVKGVEFGSGFGLAALRGSQANDPIAANPDDPSRPIFQTNHAGGTLGGISNGAPLVVRIAAKPTSSIRPAQQTVTAAGDPTEIQVHGRHDPCIVPRLVPVAEAMLAITLADAMLHQHAREQRPPTPDERAHRIAAIDARMQVLGEQRAALLADDLGHDAGPTSPTTPEK